MADGSIDGADISNGGINGSDVANDSLDAGDVDEGDSYFGNLVTAGVLSSQARDIGGVGRSSSARSRDERPPPGPRKSAAPCQHRRRAERSRRRLHRPGGEVAARRRSARALRRDGSDCPPYSIATELARDALELGDRPVTLPDPVTSFG